MATTPTPQTALSKTERILTGLKLSKETRSELAQRLKAGATKRLSRDKLIFSARNQTMGTRGIVNAVGGMPVYDAQKFIARFVGGESLVTRGVVLAVASGGADYLTAKARIPLVGEALDGLKGGAGTIMRIGLLAKDHPVRAGFDLDTKAYLDARRKK